MRFSVITTDSFHPNVLSINFPVAFFFSLYCILPLDIVIVSNSNCIRRHVLIVFFISSRKTITEET